MSSNLFQHIEQYIPVLHNVCMCCALSQQADAVHLKSEGTSFTNIVNHTFTLTVEKI